MNQHRKRIIEWNARFPLDRLYREKHNIIFGSQEHRNLCQIDIYYDWLEDEIIKELLEEIKEDEKREKEFKNGTWLSEITIETKETEEMFDSIDVEDIELPDQLDIEDNEQ